MSGGLLNFDMRSFLFLAIPCINAEQACSHLYDIQLALDSINKDSGTGVEICAQGVPGIPITWQPEVYSKGEPVCANTRIVKGST